MYPLWDIAIAPIIRAAAPKRIVEIGALRGETTVLMLESLGPDVELHVIDPAPEFDPAEHEGNFPGRYLFYRDISHNVLPDLPPIDVALVDGDHNWYTVYHELLMLRDGARRGGAPLPVLIMHDVLWPYGRRDLYYAPERIPEEFRQPYARRGMEPGRVELVPRHGGISPTLAHALSEGGPRNGVMTAFDDFVAEHDRAVRTVLVPIYHGLLIVVEQERLDATPGLAEALDEVESAETRQKLLELAERLRLRILLGEHRSYYRAQRIIPPLSKRYLDLLKAALLDDHYAENEARIEYLVERCRTGLEPEATTLADPARHLRPVLKNIRLRHDTGVGSARQASTLPPWLLPYAPMGRQRLDHLEACLDTLRDELIPGDLASCGTTRGGDAVFMAGFTQTNDLGRRVWVAGTFAEREGSDEPEPEDGETPEAGAGVGDVNVVTQAFARFGLLGDNVRFLRGAFADTLPDAPIRRLGLVRIESDDSRAIGEALDALYDKVVVGGFVLVDNFRSREGARAVNEFRARRKITEPLERIDWGGLCWRKEREATAGEKSVAPVTQPTRTPLARPAPAEALDLSVVVVMYNMKREAERTLHSLTRAYQQGIDDLCYEVLVMENGSAPDQKLGGKFVRSFGSEFRYFDLGDEATPSPVNALNRGIARSRGRSVALMIDGAHVLTPGVLHNGMKGLRAYEPAVVATQQWYVGPGQQPEVALRGYDQSYEDDLFRRISWPVDGYRLFQVGHFVGERDWFDGMSESNCLFAPRTVLEQVGGFDESFTVAGGGFANLELYERLGSHPGVNVVTILGEGSFHQTHGGTTTNEGDLEERKRRLVEYRGYFMDTRGRDFTGPLKPIYYVGSLPAHTRRTRGRRMTATAFYREGELVDADQHPTEPVIVPDELKREFTGAFWQSLDWQRSSWLGHKAQKCPTDLFAYQELVVELRPEWIIETGTGSGGRALFFASICDLLGHGRVLSIDAEVAPDVPRHDRITYLSGDPGDPATAARVAEIVGPSANALVVLGLDSRARLVSYFDAFAAFVPAGSYVILEDTVVNGHPVWTGYGTGPNEAVKDIVKIRPDFVVDPLAERYGLTFNPGGFLKRVGIPASETGDGQGPAAAAQTAEDPSKV